MIKQESKKKNKKREEKATNGTGIEEMKITKKIQATLRNQDVRAA